MSAKAGHPVNYDCALNLRRRLLDHPLSRMMTTEMSPDLAFILSLALRMAVSAAFVVIASMITERSGPAIGALVATLPVSAGPSYIFLALDHDAAFIAQSALASLPINAATVLMILLIVILAQRFGMVASLGAGLAVWLFFAVL